MSRSVFKRAATCAALFVLALWASMSMPTMPANQQLVSALLPAELFAFVRLAEARLRTEALAIEPTGGGEAKTFQVEIAETDKEKAVGLMFRTKLADNEGMLFPYGAAQDITMWMRNTYIPLDMLFIRPDGIIHRIEVNAEPMSERVISSGAPVSAVLEVPGGATGRLGIKPGDRVRHPIFTTGGAAQ